MKTTAIVCAALLATACGGELASTDTTADERATNQQELITDPWEGLFGVRRTSASTFDVNPAGAGTLMCPDGVYRTSCGVNRVSLANAGLLPDRAAAVLARIENEPAGDNAMSVLLRGTMVQVRDHTTNTRWIEFRATAAYLSPVRRTHASNFIYVSGYTSPWYATHKLNVLTIPGVREIDIAYRSRFVWQIPSNERPATGFSGVILTYNAARRLSTDLFAPIEFTIDQIFYRQ